MEKVTEYSAKMRMRDLIDNDSMLLMALSRFGIPLGFGEKSVESICDEQGVDCQTFLSICDYISFGIVRTEGISLPTLIRYLENAHIYFLDFCLPRIRRKLIEAIDCSGQDKVALLILQFYDSYTDEVRRHMQHENDTVFAYVKNLMEGNQDETYNISVFASGHHSIHSKLQELKDLVVRYLPQRNNHLLNATLFDIINCEQDLMTHCQVEDKIFVPAVIEQESRIDEIIEAKNANNANAAGQQTLLSDREREIVACVARGMSNKEIADKLCLSVHTVTTHRRNIAQKLEIHSPAGLAIYAVVNGLVSIDELKDKI